MTFTEIELLIKSLPKHSRIAVFTREVIKERDALRVKIEKLKADNEDMLWNLAACSTFAMGFNLDEPYVVSRAAPKDVLKLALEHRALRKRVEELEKALRECADEPPHCEMCKKTVQSGKETK